MKAKNKPLIVSIGDIAWDLFLEIPQGIVWGSDVPGKVEFSYGGSACNFAVWASRLGARVRLLGKVGEDFWGRLILKHLKEEKVDFPFKPIHGGRTARIGILVSPEGERAMVMDKDPQLAFSLTDFSPVFLEKCSLLFFTGYAVFSRSSLEFLKAVLDYCRKIQIKIAFDPSSFHLMDSFGPQELLKFVCPLDFLLLNEKELEAFSPRCKPQDLLSLAEMVIVKMGKEGSKAFTKYGEFFQPAFRVSARDSTGAGDAFDAGFLVNYLQSKDIQQSLKKGNRLGAYVASHIGAQPDFKENQNEEVRADD